ncbi:MAG: hypothetical protein ACKV2O_17090 [Acidimicrobiales bacterium]
MSGGLEVSAPALVDLVRAQRWYAANDRHVAASEVLESVDIGAGLWWVLLAVDFTGEGAGGAERVVYQLVIHGDSGAEALERPDVLRWMFPDLPVTSVRVLAGEQSNTSLVATLADDEEGHRRGEVIVKVFRRFEIGDGDGAAGRNPDVEVCERLWAQGFRSIAEPRGTFERDGRDLAVARTFLAGATSGWEMATEDPWFMDHIGALGTVTASMHVALAAAFGAPRVGGTDWAATLTANLSRTTVPTGMDLAVRFEALGNLADAGVSTRIHGDYHLGQVLHWKRRWYVLDFEGEPARPVAERLAPSSPLRDVAGMYRSFGYAAAVGGLPPVWEREARQRFWRGYRSVPEIGALLPAADADVATVVDAFELDKAIYELAYERRYRPDWAHIPLAAIERLAR